MNLTSGAFMICTEMSGNGVWTGRPVNLQVEPTLKELLPERVVLGEVVVMVVTQNHVFPQIDSVILRRKEATVRASVLPALCQSRKVWFYSIQEAVCLHIDSIVVFFGGPDARMRPGRTEWRAAS